MIVIPEDELRHLEKRFGPDVREMGTWNTDGSFGFCAVPIWAVENAVATVGSPNLAEALERLKNADERTEPFVEIVQRFGPALVKEIAASYRRKAARAYGAA
jgi:hypothetical protein